MSRRQLVSLEKKQEILNKVSSGSRVLAVSEEYGVKASTVYSWLRKEAVGSTNTSLELSRLQRQNKALLQLVGQLTYEQEFRKKKRFSS